MNKVILMGRLTREPDVRYTTGENSTAFARYTLAVDRRFSRRNDQGGVQQQTADFIGCVAFGKSAEFAEKYLHQGTKIVVTGRIQTGSYTNRDGQKVYTTDVVVEDQEFAESKAASAERAVNMSAPASAPRPAYNNTAAAAPSAAPSAPASSFMPAPESVSAPAAPAAAPDPNQASAGDGFMNIPDGIDEELPFA